ncbi:hypothetical protein [Zhihengliuella flava]|uniref:Uncharacterized protein n=1 Tax=Zhihengliuella flava TaxID=1285193 RepID=A0A931D3W8_9MICC|nr:hypothetical protein [Zhihengliuella flava]MBG6083939.1 hypothetical protein [Zhihengliuella flava]
MSASEQEHHASDEYDAGFEQAHDGPFRAAARWATGLVDVFWGGDGSEAAGATVVVRRIDDDAEILHITGYNITEAESLLALVRHDLASMSREDFLATWHAKDGVETREL